MQDVGGGALPAYLTLAGTLTWDAASIADRDWFLRPYDATSADVASHEVVM